MMKSRTKNENRSLVHTNWLVSNCFLILTGEKSSGLSEHSLNTLIRCTKNSNRWSERVLIYTRYIIAKWWTHYCQYKKCTSAY